MCAAQESPIINLIINSWKEELGTILNDYYCPLIIRCIVILEHLCGKKCPLRLKKVPQGGDLLPGVMLTHSPGMEKIQLRTRPLENIREKLDFLLSTKEIAFCVHHYLYRVFC